MNIELFKTNAKRNPTILYLIFSVITLGIYQWFWVFSRKNSLNKIAGSKISDALVIIYLITSILWILLSGYSQVLINMGNLFEIIQGVNYSNYANICMLVAIILQIVIAFSMKNILKEFSENNEMNISYNGFFTFLFNYVYINYKINENIDYIAQNSIVDKEETPTSVKETTSEKTPESPEDRLQKLADMKEKGLINEDEFNSKKEEILKEI